MAHALSGRVAFITGAANGIGAATAMRFVEEGTSVILFDRDAEGLRRVEGRIAETRKGAALVCVGDVVSLDDTQGAVRAGLARFGGLDTAVLNAGIEGDVKTAEETSVDDFRRVMEVNVTGAFIGVKATFPALRARGGGAVLMTSSTSGKIGAAGLTPYTASKHALIGLMRAAALEGAPSGIRVNTVNPCPVETRMMRALEEGFSPGHAEEMRAALAQSIPLKRYAEPSEIADLFIFLASDAARFITGGVYMIDGGMTAGLVRA